MKNGHVKKRPISQALKEAGYWIYSAPHMSESRTVYYWMRGDEGGSDCYSFGQAENEAKVHHSEQVAA